MRDLAPFQTPALLPPNNALKPWRLLGGISNVSEAIEVLVSRGALPEAWLDPARVSPPPNMLQLCAIVGNLQGCLDVMQLAVEAHQYVLGAVAEPRISWLYSHYPALPIYHHFGIYGSAYQQSVTFQPEALPAGTNFLPTRVPTKSRPLVEETPFTDIENIDPRSPVLIWRGQQPDNTLPVSFDPPDRARNAWNAWNTAWDTGYTQSAPAFKTPGLIRANVARRVYLSHFAAAQLAPHGPWQALLNIWYRGYAVLSMGPSHIGLLLPKLPVLP